MAKKGLTVAEAGRKGGLTTSKRHGKKFYQEIGKRGGSKGGKTTKKRHGKKFFKKIGKKGGNEVKRLIAAGRKAK